MGLKSKNTKTSYRTWNVTRGPPTRKMDNWPSYTDSARWTIDHHTPIPFFLKQLSWFYKVNLFATGKVEHSHSWIILFFSKTLPFFYNWNNIVTHELSYPSQKYFPFSITEIISFQGYYLWITLKISYFVSKLPLLSYLSTEKIS